MKIVRIMFLFLACFQPYVLIHGMMQLLRSKQLSRLKKVPKKRIVRYKTGSQYKQLTINQKPRSFFSWLRLDSLMSLFRFKKKQLQEVQPVRIVKPRFDVEKIHLTIDLEKPIQEIKDELNLYRQNYKDKKSWGQFIVTFKMNAHARRIVAVSVLFLIYCLSLSKCTVRNCKITPRSRCPLTFFRHLCVWIFNVVLKSLAKHYFESMLRAQFFCFLYNLFQ